MIPFSISRYELAQALGLAVESMPDAALRAVGTDSRQITRGHGVVFFCLSGPRHDGHRYAAELYKAGVRDFVCETGRLSQAELPEAVLYVTENPLKALQTLATYHRSECPATIIGITGSNGKTIVKEWLARALSDTHRITRSPGSYNSQIGVPLSLLRLMASDDFGIIEAGISRTGEMPRLEAMIRPDIAVLTNVGEAHLENFSSKKDLAEEKAALARGSRMVVYRSDYSEWREALAGFKGENFDWSTLNPKARMFVKIKQSPGHETPVVVRWEGKMAEFTLPGTDAASIENGLTVIASLLAIGIDAERIATLTERFRPLARRTELIEAGNGSTILSDVSNSDLVSLAATLDYARAHAGRRKMTLVLSDILSSGRPSAELYAAASRLVKEKGVDRFMGIGEEIGRHAGFFLGKKDFFGSTEEFLGQSDRFAFADEMVILKGAGAFGMERIAEKLALRSHLTRLYINLDALEHNLNALREKAGNQTGIIAVVKASAYGSGSEEIASVLEFNRVDYLAVAFADEGVRLRQAGISLPIMVLNTVPESNEILLKHRLEPEIFGFRSLEKFLDTLKRQAVSEPYPIHIKLDTGMNRLGFLPQEISLLADLLNANRDLVRVATIFSHLAAADNPNHDPFTRSQISLFADLSSILESELGYPLLKHIANTSGILRFREAQFDLVRTGIGLYGIGGDGLQPVHRLVSVISQIKDVKKGQSIGYDRSFVAPEDTRIGVVAAGYADGYPRSLSNGKGRLVVNGNVAPVVGKICMDMLMIDLSGIQANEGDEAELFGRAVHLSQIAASCERIPYEILTGISPRVKRVFEREN